MILFHLARCDSKPISINHLAAVNNLPCNSNIAKRNCQQKSTWLVFIVENYMEIQLKNHETYRKNQRMKWKKKQREQAVISSGETVAWFTINSNKRWYSRIQQMNCHCRCCYCRIETWFTHVYWLLTLGDRFFFFSKHLLFTREEKVNSIIRMRSHI